MLIVPFAASCLSAAEKINIRGSDTLLILNREWATTFMRQNPRIAIDVAGGGSGLGIAALLEGTVDIAAASRRIKGDELAAFGAKTGHAPLEIAVALDGIGIYVHNTNPVSRLTLSQLAGIFSGRIRTWKEVGGLDRRIDVYTRNQNSGTYVFFREHVLGDEDYSPLARKVPTTSALTAAVARNRGAIGYGGIGYAQGAHIIRVVAEDSHLAIWPTHEDVASRAYPLSRTLHFYVDPNSWSPAVESFVQWVLSEEGQEVVTKVGYYPLARKEREGAIHEASVVLTPDNMRQNGFVIDALFRAPPPVAGAATSRAEMIMVRLSFRPSGPTIKTINSVSLQIPGVTDVPLCPVRARATDVISSVGFSIRPELIGQASVVLEGHSGRAFAVGYRLRLVDFQSAGARPRVSRTMP
jgi:phosphate transport system substrate-binding protein